MVRATGHALGNVRAGRTRTNRSAGASILGLAGVVGCAREVVCRIEYYCRREKINGTDMHKALMTRWMIGGRGGGGGAKSQDRLPLGPGRAALTPKGPNFAAWSPAPGA